MKKIALLLSITLAVTSSNIAQQLFFEDFESYAFNRIGPQSDRWTTWSGNEGSLEDPFVIGDPTFSGAHSLEIKGDMFFPNGGPVDCILKLGDQTSGRFEVSFQLYFEEANGMYYNFQHFEEPGQEWAFEVDCPSGGLINGQVDCDILVGGELNFFTLVRGEWSKMTHIIDLDNNEASLMVNDLVVHSWPFNWQANEMSGTNQLGGVNFFPRNGFDAYVIDDVDYTMLTSAEELIVQVPKSKLYPTTVRDWATLSLSPDLRNEELIVNILGMDGRLVRQVTLSSNIDEQLNFSDLPAGSYRVIIVSANEVQERLSFVKL